MRRHPISLSSKGGLRAVLAIGLVVGVTGTALAADKPTPIHKLAPLPRQSEVAGCSISDQSPTAGNLTYGGGPVMITTTAYSIFWSPNGTISASYRTLVNRYFQDIGGTAFNNINTQYYMNPGPIYITNTTVFGGTWLDTANAYPGGRGTPADPLTGQDLKDEITRALAANPSWNPPDGSKLYFVFTEEDIESCADTFSGCTPGVTSPPPGAGSYCAYHDHFNSGSDLVIWANMPYAASWGGCIAITCSPNGNFDADVEISPTSHEHFEAVTDPLWDGPNGWTGPGFENGDKCAYNYGPLQLDGHNLVLSGNPYIIQREWSNADSGCVTRYNADVDLAVSKQDQADPVTTGSNIVYDISISNLNGSFEGTDVALADTVPSGTSMVSLSAPPGWNCTAPSPGSTGNVSCSGLSLPASATADFTLTVNLSCSLADGDTVSSTASITSSSDDPESSNDSDTEATTAYNPPPAITCPGDVSVECTGNCGIPASDPALARFFAGVSATDNCSSVQIDNNAPSFFPLGATDVTFTATDSGGAQASCTATVNVVDTTPPTILASVAPTVLWPPNHKMVAINASVAVSDICDPGASFVLTSITSNEPDNGTGDGDKPNDIQGADYGTPDVAFLLRAERSGRGTGRIYTITYTASDKSGNTTPVQLQVTVPHDQSGHGPVASGVNASSTTLGPR
jgi:uncharacterized repeat protein (TIGR01451 family)